MKRIHAGLILAVAANLHGGEIAITSPSPEHAAERSKEFRERLSPDSAYLKSVADRFFRYVHPEITLEMALGDAGVQESFQRAIALHKNGEHLAALEAYRDGFMDRLAAPKGRLFQAPRPLLPKLSAAEALAQAEVWMKDPLILRNPVIAGRPAPGTDWKDFVEENRGRVEELHLAIGVPGTINWTWTPANLTPTDAWNPERWVEDKLGDVLLASVLLRAYQDTGERRFLDRYAAILDDRHMNWLADVLASGRGVEIGVNASEGYAGEIGIEASLLGALRHLAITRPESRRAFPALTLAESLLRMYEIYLPVQMRLVRCITGNRLSHMYSHRLGAIGLSFPEFRFSADLVREKRRAFEVYPTASGYPDGHDVNWAYNYAFNYPREGTLEMLESDPRAGNYLHPEWVELQRSAMIRRIRTLAHSLFINGTAPRWAKPDQDYGVRWRKIGTGQKEDNIPSWQYGHEDILRITSAVYGDGSAGKPFAASEAFPFTGFYHLRTGWNPKEDADIFFSPYRPFHYHGPSVWGHIKLFAYGRTLLDHRSGGELLVDGVPKVESETSHLLPAPLLTNWRQPAYGPPQWHMGDDHILPYRFFTSPVFDFAEGEYASAFIAKEPPAVIDDVRQTRKVFLVKDAGIVIVSDRLQSSKARTFTLSWGFHASIPKADIIHDAERGSFRTESPDAANLAIFQASDAPAVSSGAKAGGERVERLAEIHWRGRFGQDIESENVSFHYGPARDATVITVLQARRPGEPALADFKAVKDHDVIGFDAETARGEVLSFRQALGKSAPAITLTRGADRLILDHEGEPDRAEIREGGQTSRKPIARPMELVRFEPAATVFEETEYVRLVHPEDGVEIHYTLDGTDPTRNSPVYREPIRLQKTTLVKAVAVRPGYAGPIGFQADSTDYSLSAPALYTRRKALPAVPAPESLQPGLNFTVYEGDLRLTGLTFPMAGTPRETGAVDRLDQIPVNPVPSATPYGVRYRGFLKIPLRGTYTIWAPEEFMHWAVDLGCDLKVSLNGELWEPSTQRTGFRGWSVPLEAGLHSLEVDFVDMRPGDMRPGQTTGRVYWFDYENHPVGDRLMWEHRIWDGQSLQISLSGPGLSRQPIPSAWLFRTGGPSGTANASVPGE